MDITVEVDIDELDVWSMYKDSRCEELEKILRNIPEFKACMVRRMKQSEDYQEQGDPFEVQDMKGEHLVWIYANEADILDISEIGLYALAQYERENEAEKLSKWWVIAAFLIGLGFLGIVISVGLLITLSPFTLPLFSISSITLFCGVICFHIVGRIEKKRNREIDFRNITENSFFLDILRKLASMTDPVIYCDQEYTKRLSAVEDILAGYDV